jgi:hypothetical protein
MGNWGLDWGNPKPMTKLKNAYEYKGW